MLYRQEDADKYTCPHMSHLPGNVQPCIGQHCASWRQHFVTDQTQVSPAILSSEMRRPAQKLVRSGLGFCGLAGNAGLGTAAPLRNSGAPLADPS